VDKKATEKLTLWLRQYRHNHGEGFVLAFDYDGTSHAFEKLEQENAKLKAEIATLEGKIAQYKASAYIIDRDTCPKHSDDIRVDRR